MLKAFLFALVNKRNKKAFVVNYPANGRLTLQTNFVCHHCLFKALRRPGSVAAAG